MNLKRTLPKLVVISMLIAITSGLLAYAIKAPNYGPGAMVDEHWWHIIVSDAAAMVAAGACGIDALPVPRPADLNWFLNNPANAPYGWTVTSTTRAGYTFTMENNRVWPFGTPNGSPDDPDNWRAVDFRRGVHRLINKSAIVGIYSPLKSAAEDWLPPAQAYWINPDIALPSFDPWDSANWFDAGGWVEGTTRNPYYDPEWHPASAEALRVDPVLGGPVSFEYYAIGPTEEPLGWQVATNITSWMRKMGLTVTLVNGTWLGMVLRLVNNNLYDYQFMTGTGIFWGLAPHTLLFDSTYSEKLPLWNFAHMNISEADYWGLKMMSTFDEEEVRHAAFMIQYVLQTYEPYLPLLLDEAFTAFKDPWPERVPPFTNPGYIGIVNMKGFGALGYSRNKWLLHPSASLVADNVWGKQLGRADRYDPVSGAEINRWRLSVYLDTLNPLTADTEADWQPLSCVMDVHYRLNPYTLDYMWFAAAGEPIIEPWVGPGGAEVTGPGNGVYDAPVTYDPDGELLTYNGIAVDDVTADDLVGDDTLAMKTSWELKDCLYWQDSDPGPDLEYGTGDDGVVHQVTAADYKFGVDLLMNQDNVRYHAIWQFISMVKVHDDFHYTVYEERRYPWAFEGHGIGLLTPKHLWEPFIAGVDGILWTEDDNDHRDWYGWEEAYMLDPVRQQAGLSPMWLTHLIGFGPFVYHLGGWLPGVFVHVEENPCYYYAIYDGSDPLIGDTNMNGVVEIGDMYIIIDSFALHPNVDPWYDPRGDIAYWAQTIELDDIYAAIGQIGKRWYP